MVGKPSYIARLTAFAVLIFLVGCAGSKSRLKVGQSAEGEVVEAEGLAPNTDDLIATKRASLLDAQRNAIEKAVGVFVSARTLVEKAIAIENNILAKTDGYIKKYDILNESVEDGLYKTRIRALVALHELEADLKDMALLNTPELQRPRVLLSIKEKIDGRAINEGAATQGLETTLIDQGYVVVSKDRPSESELNLSGNASAFPFKSQGLGGFVSYRARMNVQARRPGTKDIVASVAKEASGLGGSPQLAGLKALETVSKLVGEEIGVKISDAWSQGRNLLVFVEGASSFADVDRIRKHLSAQPGVKDLILRRFDDDLAQFELQLGKRVDTGTLAGQLEASKTLPVKILESSAQVLRLKRI